MCVCIHRDRRGNTIWTSRKKELAKSSRRERDIYMCVCVRVLTMYIFSHQCLLLLCVCVWERERESEESGSKEREKSERERSREIIRELQGTWKTVQWKHSQMDRKPSISLSLSVVPSFHLSTPFHNPLISFVYFIKKVLLAICPLKGRNKRERQKKQL